MPVFFKPDVCYLLWQVYLDQQAGTHPATPAQLRPALQQDRGENIKSRSEKTRGLR